MKSSAFDKIARSLRCEDKHDYETRALVRIRHDGQLAETLRRRIGELSQMLGGIASSLKKRTPAIFWSDDKVQ